MTSQGDPTRLHRGKLETAPDFCATTQAQFSAHDFACAAIAALLLGATGSTSWNRCAPWPAHASRRCART